MFNSYYKLKITGKDVKRYIMMLYKTGIFFEDILLSKNTCYLKVDSFNYEKIIDIKTTYEIEVVRLYGNKKIELLLRQNLVFITAVLFGILLLYFLSNIIFNIEIIHSDQSIKSLIKDELNKYGIKKYSFMKDYEEIQKIKENILHNNKEKLEWIELERVGTTYKIRLEKRIINNKVPLDSNKHIVAKKSGIIMKIVAEKGEIVKKVNDYVKSGDIIISGNILKNKETVANVSASGRVYAEVWYNVKVELPINYKEELFTGKSKNVINIKFLTYDTNLFDFNRFKQKKISEEVLLSDFFGLFKISYNKEYEVIIKDEVNNIVSEEYAADIASRKLEENLAEDEYIISRKKLKTVVNDSTIVTEIFFKVYENISSPKYFSQEEGS